MTKRTTLNDVDTIIFDFDGTLHRGEAISLPIFKNCLEQFQDRYNVPKEIPSDEEILSEFGKQTQDIYPSILKTEDMKIIKAFAECVEVTEVDAFNSGKGELYENVESTLLYLKNRGYKLALCTNARLDYFKAVVARFQLNKFFELLIASGLYPGKDKTWMVKTIVKQLNSNKFAVVGDRYHDIEAAKTNHGLAIGCSYGFGSKEVGKADIIIDSFNELLNIF